MKVLVLDYINNGRYLTYTAKSIKFFTSESGIGIDEKDIVTVFLINFAAFKP